MTSPDEKYKHYGLNSGKFIQSVKMLKGENISTIICV